MADYAVSNSILQRIINQSVGQQPIPEAKINPLPNHSVRFHEGKYYMEIELPGVDPNNIDISVNNDTIRVTVDKTFMHEFVDENSGSDEDVLVIHSPRNSEEKSVAVLNNKSERYNNYVRGKDINNNYNTGEYAYDLVFPYKINKGFIDSYYKFGVLGLIITPESDERFNVEVKVNE